MRPLALSVAVILVATGPSVALGARDSDGRGSQLIGGRPTTSVSENQSRLDVALTRTATRQTPGTTGRKRTDVAVTNHGPNTSGNASSVTTDEVDWATAATDDLGGSAPEPCLRSGTEVPCAAPSPVAPAGPAASTTGPRIPTLTDIASFRPSTPSLTAEPGSFGIAGRPTNFVVSATPQALTGTLFGLPVTVRFTPAAYRFDYGDGTTNTTHTGGSTWKAGHEPLFTPTGTSHVYRRKGQVTVRVAVAYSAQVSFAGHPGWYDVDGYVTANAPEKQFRIYVAHTVLVEHTCDEDPRGPGCPGTAP